MSTSLSSFFSDIFPVVHADSEENPANGTEVKQEGVEEPDSEPVAAEEEDEPEDVSYQLLCFGQVDVFLALNHLGSSHPSGRM
jgi:hypothetical protein